MESLEKLSLAKIVTLKPEAASLLEKHNLDFCCRGKQTLSEALLGNEEKLREVTNELNVLFKGKGSGSEINFEDLRLSQLIDHILDVHHSFVREFNPLILGHVNKIAEKHGGRHPELIKIAQLFNEVKIELDQHMMKEEVILFPRIRQMEENSTGTVGKNERIMIEGPVHVMEAEHERAGNILHEIKNITNNYTPPTDACTTYKLAFDELKMFELDLHQHVHLENNILFPKAIAMQGIASKIILN